ncbi:THAP domain-containing protein 11-like [Stylophora pistillata]|uniref:THAP domain-containing protein 11-like n=1 Tax=Stylophora pistillata TaxID=50429 RepID=UPI000C052CF5|nr:THAP domain-containing protein 11-like [Stylophora pistillata]
MAHYNCGIPGCTNSYRYASNLQYYRIPKDPDIRRKYVVLMRNETLKLDSTSTWICSAHFDGGEKLRTRLPSIFTWRKPTAPRTEVKRASFEDTQKMEQTEKRKTTLAQLPLEANFKFEEQSENINVNTDTSTSVEIQTLLTGDQLNSL